MILVLAHLAGTHEPTELDRTFDALIVPGCPADADGQLGDCLWRRASWAAELYHAGVVSNIVTSGAAVYTPHVEAEGLRRALLHLDVPADRIVVEPDARHTDENAAFSLLICQERGWTDLAVASDNVHAVIIDKMLTEWGAEAYAIPLMAERHPPAPDMKLREVAGWQRPELVDARVAPRASLGDYFWKGLTSPILTHQPPRLGE